MLNDSLDGLERFDHFLMMASALLGRPCSDMLAHDSVKVELALFWDLALNQM